MSQETKEVAKLQQKIYRYSIDSMKTSVIATQKILVLLVPNYWQYEELLKTTVEKTQLEWMASKALIHMNA